MDLNPIDRQIMELKGWTHDPFGDGNEATDCWGPEVHECEFMVGDEYNPPWSQSDAKAFELVDELRGQFAFDLSCSPSGLMWYATSSPVRTGPAALIAIEAPKATGSGVTRPESICLAYIAARSSK